MRVLGRHRRPTRTHRSAILDSPEFPTAANSRSFKDHIASFAGIPIRNERGLAGQEELQTRYGELRIG
ncbi:hypothetical protein U1Q18_004639 [Sarracenia purpurea var. burkii]